VRGDRKYGPEGKGVAGGLKNLMLYVLRMNDVMVDLSIAQIPAIFQAENVI
jgi:hypothetical protein